MATAQVHRLIGHLRPAFAGNADADLVAEFQRTRNPEAFNAIVRRHGQTVLNACRQVLRAEEDVDDAFQATFLVLFKNPGSIRQGHSLRSWLFGVAHRVAVNARCRRAKHEARERTNEDPPHPESADANDLSWREASAILHEELNRLPEKLRLPLLLCHLEGKSRDEAAAELGWSLNVVKGALERGRQRLRRRLERRGIALSAGLFTVGGAAQAVPRALVDSASRLAESGVIRPSVSTLARGAIPMMPLKQYMLAASLLVLAGFGAMLTAGAADEPVKKGQAVVADTAEPKPASKTIAVQGKVVDAAGKPLAGVKLQVPFLKRRPPVMESDLGYKEVGRTEADGSFSVSIEAVDQLRFVAASHRGFGFGWANIPEDRDAAEVTITLPKDVAVQGRVIDTEGKAVSGATVRALDIAVVKKDLEAYMTAWGVSWRDAAHNQIAGGLPAPVADVAAATTDKDGRFTLHGIGGERVAQIEVESKAHGKQKVYVLTREGIDVAPANKAANDKMPPAQFRFPGDLPRLSGPNVEFVLQTGKTIEGTVTDAATGKPMAGVWIATNSGNTSVRAQSDKNGQYRLPGLIKHREYLVHTMLADPKSTYLNWSARVADSDGLAPIRHDIQMTRGIVVKGKVTDRGTGKPVNGSVRFAPLPDNTYFGTKPAYKGYDGNRMSESVVNGTFRVVTIPGKSAVMVQAYERNAVRIGGVSVNPYRLTGPDPDHPDYFQSRGGDLTFATAGGGIEFLGNEHAVKVVDLKPDVPEVEVNLTVDRGSTATLQIVGPDGKPLTGATVAGLTASWPKTFTLPKDTETIYALDGKTARTLYILHAEKKLGATVTVPADAKGPVVAKLTAAGSAKGRLVDLDGHALAGVTVSVGANGAAGELYRFANLGQKPLVTDKDGAFQVDHVVPGMSFYLNMQKGPDYFIGEPRIGTRKVEAGQVLDLSVLKVRAQRVGQ